MSKIVIYQVFPRYFGNCEGRNLPGGTIEENGVGKFKDFSTRALSAIRQMGVTHIWHTGVLEHATQTDYTAFGIAADHPAVVKGRAGSPYAVKDYYDVDPDLAVSVPDRLKEFKLLVGRTHRAGMKVIIDFVPNHLARRYHSDVARVPDFGQDDDVNVAFSPRNNFYYLPGEAFRPQFDRQGTAAAPYEEYPAKVTGNDCFTASPSVSDWYETVKLNYGLDYQGGRTEHFSPVPDTWEKMLHILDYWAGFGVDGFRCDMAEMVPPAFWRWVIAKVRQKHKSLLFIGEVYNPGLYRTYMEAGFDYLYDKVGLYDTLKSVTRGYAPAFAITSCWQRLGDLQDRMLNFLENHDEQRIASPFFAGDPWKAIPALIVSVCLRNNPFMLYAGQELGETGMYAEGFSGEDGRSTIFDYWRLDSLAGWNNHGKFDGAGLSSQARELQAFYRKLLQLCQSEPALSQGLFFDLMYVNGNQPYFDLARQYAFLRRSEHALLLIVVNFDEQPRLLHVNIPAHAFEYLRLEESPSRTARELLTDETRTLPLEPDGFVSLHVAGNRGCIWKFELEK
ncbi:MAG: alpha-amylase family protein [Bacteroidales bacterium]|nr:alpha-amylase family protein [Bacteroidales bacterium]